mmetsp:Transcript_6061/g.14683  ORF Transcript_6061/g.14683 Transcript_6061/m.14683 type:complete len:303 (-) Transcript_6061:286-1194(-)
MRKLVGILLKQEGVIAGVSEFLFAGRMVVGQKVFHGPSLDYVPRVAVKGKAIVQVSRDLFQEPVHRVGELVERGHLDRDGSLVVPSQVAVESQLHFEAVGSGPEFCQDRLSGHALDIRLQFCLALGQSIVIPPVGFDLLNGIFVSLVQGFLFVPQVLVENLEIFFARQFALERGVFLLEFLDLGIEFHRQINLQLAHCGILFGQLVLHQFPFVEGDQRVTRDQDKDHHYPKAEHPRSPPRALGSCCSSVPSHPDIVAGFVVYERLWDVDPAHSPGRIARAGRIGGVCWSVFRIRGVCRSVPV